jgi:hypothetical protein
MNFCIFDWFAGLFVNYTAYNFTLLVQEQVDITSVQRRLNCNWCKQCQIIDIIKKFILVTYFFNKYCIIAKWQVFNLVVSILIAYCAKLQGIYPNILGWANHHCNTGNRHSTISISYLAGNCTTFI